MPAGVALACAVAGSGWTWGALGDARPTWTVLAVVVVLGLLVLAAPAAPQRWWRAAHPVQSRAGLEVGAATAAVVAAATGLDLAPLGERASWAAVYLTALGVAVTVVSLQRADRRSLGWVGGGLLAAASWVRLFDLGVHAPEAYTLPSAAALLVVGLAHLRRHPGSSTWTTLAPGISLASVPSLLWVLAEPTGPRALWLGLGCLALVLVGARLGWTAPLVLGAAVGSVLVLRLAAPYVADAVPRWMLIGAAGALLLAVGATWERRVSDARQVATYMRALR
jgi:cell division protein FtsW (lipid II flippase)